MFVLFSGLSVAAWLQEMQSGADNMPAMCPDLFERLLVMSDLAVRPPRLNKTESRSSASGRSAQVKYSIALVLPFGIGQHRCRCPRARVKGPVFLPSTVIWWLKQG